MKSIFELNWKCLADFLNAHSGGLCSKKDFHISGLHATFARREVLPNMQFLNASTLLCVRKSRHCRLIAF
jgi:hypothetical protein